MYLQNGHNYNDYVYFAYAAQVSGEDLWEPRVSITKPNQGHQNDVNQHYFSAYQKPLSTHDEAVAFADQLARKLIDRVVPGLSF